MSTLNIPLSSTCVTVKIIDVANVANVPAEALFTPPVRGFTTVPTAPSFVFLLEHPSGHKVLFDLGIRKDWENLPPAIVERFRVVGHQPSAEKNVSEVLDEAGVEKESIDAVIWSHAHWDHMGDMSTFSSATDLVVGPGFKDHFLSGGSPSALGSVLPSDIEGRTVREISFSTSTTLKIGDFPAYDYFQDGSLYLLDSPGHCIGHLCALVRTTSKPDTFVFLGGDAAHHCGEFRPSLHLPLPETITPDPAYPQERQVPFCPGSWFENVQKSRNRDPKGPLWQPAFGHDMTQFLTTIMYMQEYDGNDSIFVILTHDTAIRSPDVPFFPRAVNDWKERGLAKKLKWEWIGEVIRVVDGNNI